MEPEESGILLIMTDFDTILGMLRHTKTLIGLVSLAICLALLPLERLGVDVAYASSSIGPLIKVPAAGSNICQNIFTYVSWGLSIVQFLGFFVLVELEALLNPNAYYDIMASAGGEDILNNIWIVSRNIVNIILAFLLIAGAAITIVKGEGTIIKTYAKKFILAVILVNFSWFFPRVILDVATIATTTVYNLPSNIPSGDCMTSNPFSDTLIVEPCKTIQDYKFFKKNCDAGFTVVIDEVFCFKEGNLDAQANNPYVILNGLVVNFGRFPWLNQVVERDATTTTNSAAICTKFVMTAFVGFIITVGMVFPMIAMLLVFIVRIPVIWLTIAFMPFYFLGYALGDLGKFDGRSFTDILKIFLQAAFIPAMTGVPLSVGFIMMRALANPDNAPVASSLARVGEYQGVLISGIHSFYAMIWLLMSVMIMWIGVFTILKSFKITSTAVGFIQTAGKSAVTLAAALPLAAPILPQLQPIFGTSSPLGVMSKAKRLAKNPMLLFGDDLTIGTNDDARGLSRATASDNSVEYHKKSVDTVGKGKVDKYNNDIKNVISTNTISRADPVQLALLKDMKKILEANGRSLDADAVKELHINLRTDKSQIINSALADKIVTELKALP